MVDFTKTKAGDKPNPIREAIDTVNAIDDRIEMKMLGGEAAIVHSYDFATQRVSIKLKNRPDHPIIHGVPVANQFGTIQIITPLKEGDVGVAFPLARGDSRNFSNDKVASKEPSVVAGGASWMFLPGGKITSKDLPDVADPNADASTPDNAGPLDGLIRHTGGIHMIFKSDGKLVIKAETIYLLNNSPQDSDGTTSSAVPLRLQNGNVTNKILASD